MTPLEVIEKQGLEYKMAGRDILVRCLNPDHNDTNPSMRIDKITGLFHCFACGYKGNLLQKYNVYTSRTSILRNRLKDKIHKQLTENTGIRFPANAEFWEFNYRNISADTYKKFKAFTHSEFKDRLIFPIFDVTKKLVLLQARSMDGSDPKYLFFPSNVEPPMFPLPVKPILGSVILVEGIFDVLNLYDKGIENVVTCFGTQSVTEDKLKLLHLLGVTTIHVFFDGDPPGQNAAARLEKVIMGCGFQYNNIYYDKQDPGELTAPQVERLKNRLWPEY